MTPPLGIGLAVGGTALWGTSGTIMEDKFWCCAECTTGEVKPLEKGIAAVKVDSHETWKLDGEDYMPRAEGEVQDEGCWDLDGNDDIQPIDES